MEQELTGRARLGMRMIVFGCFLFFLYGVTVAFISERVAAYEYHAFSGLDFYALTDEAREFSSILTLVLSLLGAGLALCAGSLFLLGLTRWLRGAFLAGLIGGAIGLTALIVVHMNQKAWILFGIDNACLFFISTGVTLATREILSLVRGNPPGDSPPQA